MDILDASTRLLVVAVVPFLQLPFSQEEAADSTVDLIPNSDGTWVS
jgi:hypothetical protein